MVFFKVVMVVRLSVVELNTVIGCYTKSNIYVLSSYSANWHCGRCEDDDDKLNFAAQYPLYSASPPLPTLSVLNAAICDQKICFDEQIANA